MQSSAEAGAPPEVTVAFRHVSICYGRRQVLQEVDIELHRGVTFLVGQNGVGKTSLFRVLLGTLAPSQGHVEVRGSEVTHSSRRGIVSRIGFLPQSFTAPVHMRVLDFVRYVAWLHGVPRSDQTRAAHDALHVVDLSDRSRDRIGVLSGGMLRRLGVAQALVHDPEVLLLDEPTVGLDPTARVSLRRLLERLAVERTVVCSTHLLEDAAMTGGSLVALHDGRVAFHGSTNALVARAVARTPTGMSALEHAFTQLVSGEAGEEQTWTS